MEELWVRFIKSDGTRGVLKIAGASKRVSENVTTSVRALEHTH